MSNRRTHTIEPRRRPIGQDRMTIGRPSRHADNANSDRITLVTHVTIWLMVVHVNPRLSAKRTLGAWFACTRATNAALWVCMKQGDAAVYHHRRTAAPRGKPRHNWSTQNRRQHAVTTSDTNTTCSTGCRSGSHGGCHPSGCIPPPSALPPTTPQYSNPQQQCCSHGSMFVSCTCRVAGTEW